MSQGEDELRPATVLFADVVGSTALGERLAPEEVKALVGECVNRMTRAVEEFGGQVQAFMGDGICAFWVGVPRAHEDDPERAARAALLIIDVVGEYARDVEAAWGIEGFSVRVGVNTGQVAVGLVGGSSPQEIALGDTTNVGARLQSIAEPGTISVGGATASRLGHRFVIEPLGEVEVKGRKEPVAAWRLLRPRAVVESGLRLPFVGREAEVERLSEAVRELVAGRGQILSITGEAGIGKSRLLEKLHELSLGAVTWLQGDCLPYGGELVLSPFVAILRSWLGVSEGEPEVVVRTKLRARFGQHAESLPALGRLLRVRLDPDAGDATRTMPAEELAAGLRRAYVGWVEELAAEQPLVLALEDVHWADASTRELAEELLGLTDRAPVLLAVTSRLEPGSEGSREGSRLRVRVLTEYSHRAVELPLGPLSEDAAAELLGTLLPGVLDDAAKLEMVARAEGNPLYLEELLRALIDGGGLVRRRTWTLDLAAAARSIPPALEGLLVSRIDALSADARRLAQVAAVLGRTFSVRVLEHILEPELVSRELPALLRAEIVRELRRYPELECTFRHGLLQQAALSTLTPERLRELHGRVAAAIEEVYADSLDEHLELLAAHYGRSDQLDKALAYLTRAVERAEELHADAQANELRERASRVAARLGKEAPT